MSDYIIYGSYSDTVLVLGIPTIEDLVKGGVGEDAIYTVSWGSVSAADSFELEVSDRYNFSNSVLFDIAGNEKEFSIDAGGLSAGELELSGSYYYRVRSRAGEDNYSFPSEVGLIVTDAPPNSSVPVARAASDIGFDIFTANWDGVGTGYTYEISVDTDFGFGSSAEFVFGNNIAGVDTVVTGLARGTVYYYRVRSKDGSNVLSDYSNKIGVLTLPGIPEIAQGDIVDVAATSFRILWSPPSDPHAPSSYDLEISKSKDFPVSSSFTYSGIGDTSLFLFGLDAGEQYYYHVRSVNSSGQSEWSDDIASPSYPVAPNVSVPSRSSSSFEIKWDSVAHADGYRVSVSLASDFGCCLLVDREVVSDTMYSVSALAPGNVYYYRVSSLQNIHQYESDYSVGEVLLSPGVPILRDSRYVSDGVELSWRPTSPSTFYSLQISRDPLFNDLVDGYEEIIIEDASITISNLVSGVEVYYYHVASGNLTGESAYSEFKSFIVIDPPTLLPGSDYSSDGFRVNWDVMDGIDSVLLEVSLSSSFNDFVVSVTLDGVISSYDLIDLDAATSYYYRLRSKEGEYVSSYSVVGIGLTFPASIESLEARIVGSRSFEARWEPSSGDIDYELSVSSDSSFEDLLPDYAAEVISGDHSRNYYDIVFADTFRFSFTEKYEKTEENDVGRLYNTSSESYRFLILSEDRSVVVDTVSLNISSLYYNFHSGVVDTLDELNLYYSDYSVRIPEGYWAVPLDRKDFSFLYFRFWFLQCRWS